MASGLKKLLGDTLVSKDGQPYVSTLENYDVVAILFSAGWSNDCIDYIPKLEKVYRELRAAGKKFEVVFVSSDRDQKAFNRHYKKMPWLAISYDDRSRKNNLWLLFKVPRIPTLVLVKGNGDSITKYGQEVVLNQSKYPWPQPSFDEALGDSFVTSVGTTSGRDDLSDKYLGLYFSDGTPPCSTFTQTLVDVYNQVKENRQDFEVVFVASRMDENSFKNYHKKMPWLALPFDARDSRMSLSRMFQVKACPAFVMIDKSCELLNRYARAAVTKDKAGADFPWKPKIVRDIDPYDESVFETVSLVVLCEGESRTGQEKARSALLTLAESLKKESSEESRADIVFFIGTDAKKNGFEQRIRALTNAKKATSTKPNTILLLLNKPDGSFYMLKENPTLENLQKFWDDYHEGKLEREQLNTEDDKCNGVLDCLVDAACCVIQTIAT